MSLILFRFRFQNVTCFWLSLSGAKHPVYISVFVMFPSFIFLSFVPTRVDKKAHIFFSIHSWPGFWNNLAEQQKRSSERGRQEPVWGSQKFPKRLHTLKVVNGKWGLVVNTNPISDKRLHDGD